jgi:hypothetical protein
MILAEDRQQQQFARRWLVARGYDKRKIVLLDIPVGEGAGEQYVRRKYPDEVAIHRRKANHINLRLLVLIDADTSEVQYRLGQLAESLEAARAAPVERKEGIALLVPRRNIETWVHYLGNQADESTDYKPKTMEEVTAAAERLAGEPSAVAPDAPPSLLRGRVELERVCGAES